jgi:type VI secretion system protein ImpG
VNLFPQVAEPVQLNQRRAEYPLIPDVRRPYSVEVFSVDEVTAINTADQTTTTYEPFYSLRHAERGHVRNCFWLARRRPSSRPNDDGADIALSLVDLSMATADPDATVLSIRTTCTNRDLPARLPFGNQDSDFEMESPVAMKRIVALRKPTSPVRPAMEKGVLWRLISHLSLNYLSLVEEGKDALKEILRLYDVGRTAWSQNVIESILDIRTRRHVARLVSEQGISLARGLRIELELDEEPFTGAGAFLFGAVLEQFFGLAASLNSFTQLSITTPQRREGLHEWQPRSGRRILV